MEVQKIAIDPERARELWRDYKTHLHYSTPIDDEVRRTYQLIAQGRMVIRALESIKNAGLDAEGLPKLAICRAHGQRCRLRRTTRGNAEFSHLASFGWNNTRDVVRFADGTFKYPPAPHGWYREVEAVVPIIPAQHRPKRGIANYHILWEADWHDVPGDPLLLRRIGRGDMWLVLAQWDLTEVERAALAARIGTA